MSADADFLREEYTVETPESVAFGYEVAGIGSRFIGALVDTILLAVGLTVATLAVLAALGVAGIQLERAGGRLSREQANWFGGLAIAAYALVTFALLWGYYILFEWLWNGQTPGKRLARLRVIGVDGNPAGAIAIVIRNLVRLVDFLPFAYGLGLMTMFLNRRCRRLGDFAAGTLVVKERRDVTLADLQPAGAATALTADELARADALLPAYPESKRLTAADYDLIQEVLRRDRRRLVDGAVVARLAGALATRLGRARPADGEARQVLEEIALLYRRRHA